MECFLMHSNPQSVTQWHTPAQIYLAACTVTAWARALILEILAGSHKNLLSLEAENKTLQWLQPMVPKEAHPPSPLSWAFSHRGGISLVTVSLRSLMRLWKEISFSLPSHFNIWTAKSCCSEFWVLFCLALYGNFTLNKHYTTVKGMRWLRGSVMVCEAFLF